MSFINTAGDVSVAAAAEYGGRAGVGIYAGEVVWRQWKAAVRVIDGFCVVQEEGTFGLVELSLLAAKDEGAEFEAGVHIWEEWRQIGFRTAVLEIKQATHTSAWENGLEESGRGFVGVDARGREQADKTIRLNQVHCTLDEQRIQVDVACAQQG